MKHSSTPWRLQDMPLPARKLVRVVDADGGIVAILPQKERRAKFYTLRDVPELQERADLIVAAPDLLGVCQATLEDLLNGNLISGDSGGATAGMAIENLQAAITKATLQPVKMGRNL